MVILIPHDKLIPLSRIAEIKRNHLYYYLVAAYMYIIGNYTSSVLLFDSKRSFCLFFLTDKSNYFIPIYMNKIGQALTLLNLLPNP